MLVLLHNFAKASSFAAFAASAIAAVLRVVRHDCSIAAQRYCYEECGPRTYSMIEISTAVACAATSSQLASVYMPLA